MKPRSNLSLSKPNDLQAADHLTTVWQRHFTPPDSREIWEWIAQEGELPSGAYAVPGRLDIELVPQIKAPLQALRNPVVRDVTCMAAIQCLKTLIGEMFLLWLIANAPGPTQWLQGTDQEAKEHALERFLSLLECFPVLRHYYTSNRHDRTSTFLKLRHMFMRMEGVDTVANLQRKTIKNQMRSEVWQREYWKPGKLKEASARLTQFVHNSKTYTESQAGWIERDENGEVIGDDLYLHWLSGTQGTWNFPCLSCGKFQPYLWSHFREDGTRAAMRWEDSERTRRGRQWIWSALAPTIRYECIYCGNAHPDDPLTRARMNRQSKYVLANPEATSHESFTYNQLSMTNLSWFETKIGGVKNFLLANEQAESGYDNPLREFFQKVVCEPWDDSKRGHFLPLPTVELTSQEQDPDKMWDKKHARIMTVDVQQDHFWFLVIGFAAGGDFLIFDFQKSYSWDDLRLRQEQWKVDDQNVCVDSQWGKRQSEVHFFCAIHGHIVDKGGQKYWNSWKAMQGDDAASFPHRPKSGRDTGRVISLPYTWPGVMVDPMQGMRNDQADLIKQVKGKRCPLYRWSNPTIKDVAKHLRDRMQKKQLGAMRAGLWNDELSKHLYSESKRPNSRRGGRMEWQMLGKRPNHGWDCFCMAIVRAMQLGGVAAPVSVGGSDLERTESAVVSPL